jgi:hypothetical protein
MDSVADSLFFNPVPQPRVFRHQFELELAPVVHREKHFGWMLAILPRFLGGGLNAIDRVHARHLRARPVFEARKFTAFVTAGLLG